MKRIAFILAVVLVATALGWMRYRHVQEMRAAQALAGVAVTVPVTLGTAEAHDVPIYVRGVGTVQAYNMVAIKSRVDGEIVSVGFTEGQDAKAGALLFQIDPRPYQATLAQATANKDKDEALLATAQADLKRYEQLVQQRFQSQQSYEDQKGLVAQTQAAIRADQAMIESAQLNLQYTSIRSPIDGRTGARLVDIGNLVRASDNSALVTVAQIKPIFVSFTAPQTELDAIRGNQASSPLDVLVYSQDDRQQLAAGTLTLIDNQVDPTTGTIHLKATFANADGQLWPGEFVNARLIVSVAKGAVTVAATAVQQGPSGPYLYVVSSDSEAHVRAVQVNQIENGVAVIGKGLAVGERVVVDGQYRLFDGAKIETNVLLSTVPATIAESDGPGSP